MIRVYCNFLATGDIYIRPIWTYIYIYTFPITKKVKRSVLSRFRFSGGRLKFSEGPLTKKIFAIQLFMKSTVYFRVGESKFRVGAAHPAHPVDKSLVKRCSNVDNKLMKDQIL